MQKFGRHFGATALLLLLGGCWWTGPVLYPPDPSVAAPLRPGTYIEHEPGGAEKKLTVTRDTDGAWRAVGDDGEPIRMVFAPLNARSWIAEVLPKATESGAIFGLAWRRREALALAVMECKGNEALATRAGGEVRGQPANPECVFNDRGSLERAIRTWLISHPQLEAVAELRRVGD